MKTKKRENSFNFFWVIIDEYFNLSKHIKLVKTKISKNVGILFWASHFLDGQSLKEIYLSFIDSGLNNCYVAWSGNTKTELGKILK